MVEALFPQGCVLVVGGSGGIGRHICLEFAQAGTDVALTYNRNLDAADQVAGTIRAGGRNATVHQLSVDNGPQIIETIAEVERLHGRIHTIVYGAGPEVDQLYISQYTVERWQKSIDLETTGFFRIVQASLGLFKRFGGGSYVHIGSVGHLRWPNKDGLSVIPKAATEALITGIAKEEGRNGIRANSVLVGVIEAGMFHELSRKGVFDKKWKDATKQLLAIKRFGKPEEVGQAAVFLASNKADYITGQKISVAGGYGL